MPTSTTPKIMVATKLWMACPPKNSSASSASVTVAWVMIERDSVELTETLSRSGMDIRLYRRSISRMRS